jgi:hypothetical protein
MECKFCQNPIGRDYDGVHLLSCCGNIIYICDDCEENGGVCEFCITVPLNYVPFEKSNELTKLDVDFEPYHTLLGKVNSSIWKCRQLKEDWMKHHEWTYQILKSTQMIFDTYKLYPNVPLPGFKSPGHFVTKYNNYTKESYVIDGSFFAYVLKHPELAEVHFASPTWLMIDESAWHRLISEEKNGAEEVIKGKNLHGSVRLDQKRGRVRIVSLETTPIY